ncbi:hypothetical protein LIER_14356 [Lithospermum erythrorhizon]|uniref:Uncharacterized protein n=1 Tax=Lithospermum erythrorhizon TaxID=34254 RepID=A0AAV3Q246_LITER
MARTKRTTRRVSPPLKSAKSAGGVNVASLSPSPPTSPSSTRPSVGPLSPKPSLDRALHDALSLLLDQGIMQRMANLAFSFNASFPDGSVSIFFFLLRPPLHPVPWRMVTLPCTSRTGLDWGIGPGAPQGGGAGARAACSPSPGQQLTLGHDPTGSRAKEGPGREGRCGPSLPSCPPGEGGPEARLLPGQPFEMLRISVAVLSDFVLYSQDRSPTLSALAEENRQRYPTGWLDKILPAL